MGMSDLDRQFANRAIDHKVAMEKFADETPSPHPPFISWPAVFAYAFVIGVFAFGWLAGGAIIAVLRSIFR